MKKLPIRKKNPRFYEHFQSGIEGTSKSYVEKSGDFSFLSATFCETTIAPTFSNGNNPFRFRSSWHIHISIITHSVNI
jgi:hypothetical protein